MQYVRTAVAGKGLQKTLNRSRSIVRRYGLTPHKIERSLSYFTDILKSARCKATFPITCAALRRNSTILEKYPQGHIEYAVHGYYHVDHTQLSYAEQMKQLDRAKEMFARHGNINPGFRAPYLRWNKNTLKALKLANYLYDSSQALYWENLDPFDTDAHQRALEFYRAIPAEVYPSLPSIHQGLVRIPYSLPDDEGFVERMGITNEIIMEDIWTKMLNRAYRLGEFCTISIHPERIGLCGPALQAILQKARNLSPQVWITSLTEIAQWWRGQFNAQVLTSPLSNSRIGMIVKGPQGITPLARGVKIQAPTSDWAQGYQRIHELQFTVQSPRRPFIGISPQTSLQLKSFLCQQGYIVETSDSENTYSLYLDRQSFTEEDKRPLLEKIETSSRPLLRLGRWPDGARSAMAVTGDIDAVTLFDYGMRILGR